MSNTYEALELDRYNGRRLTVDIVVAAAIGVMLWYGSGFSSVILAICMDGGITLPPHVNTALQIGRFAVFALLVIVPLFGTLLWNRKKPIARTYSSWLWISFCVTLPVAAWSAYGFWMAIAYYFQAVSQTLAA